MDTIISDPICIGSSNGGVSVNLEGGVQPYQYDTISFTSILELSGFSQGNYTLNIFDANGCEYIQSFDLEDQFSTFSEEVDAVRCNGNADGAAEVIPLTGFPPYSYQWEDGQNTALATDLLAGTYLVTVTDALGCEYILSSEIEEPSALLPTTNIVDVLCHGESTGEVFVMPVVWYFSLSDCI